MKVFQAELQYRGRAPAKVQGADFFQIADTFRDRGQIRNIRQLLGRGDGIVGI